MSDALHKRSRDARHPWVIAAIVLVVVALAGASAALVVVHQSATASATEPKHGPVVRLQLASTSPPPGATAVPTDAVVSLVFTTALATASPMPTLTPAVAGTWVHSAPNTLEFQASGPLPPGVAVSVSIPGGRDGVRGANGQVLTQSTTTQFTVAQMTTLRTQQLLATLGYLPVTFTPATGATVAPDEMANPQVGTFAWRWSTFPGTFLSLWSPGVPNVVTEGAVMAFESQHNLATDGVAGPKVWGELLAAAQSNQVDSDANYDWVDVSTHVPEQAVVWRNGQVAYTTLANTGIEAAPTEIGTWPVYARYVSTTMSGTNPDGSHYADPGVPWVSYFHGGDALHGFIRSSYGYPQSLGCVELPPSHAEIVFPYTPLGTLVTVD